MLLCGGAVEIEGHKRGWVSRIEMYGIEMSAFDDVFDGNGDIL